MDMETDGPLLDDVNLLKKKVEEEAIQVRNRLVEQSIFFFGLCSLVQSNYYGPIFALYFSIRLGVQIVY